jgi:hypothetical protein
MRPDTSSQAIAGAMFPAAAPLSAQESQGKRGAPNAVVRAVSDQSLEVDREIAQSAVHANHLERLPVGTDDDGVLEQVKELRQFDREVLHTGCIGRTLQREPDHRNRRRRAYPWPLMDAGRDPISELRETLRQDPVTWVPDRDAHPAHVRLPDLRPHLDIGWRRAGGAMSRMLRSAGPFLTAAARSIDAARHRVVRGADRAGADGVRLLSQIAVSLSRSARASVAAAARLRPRRRVKPAASEPDPVQPVPVNVAEDDGARRLEERERRQLEQRIEALGPDHPDVAVLLQLVAERCAARGAQDDALALYGQALRIQETAFGPDSPALRPLLGDLADLELELGHDQDALRHRARRDMLEPRVAAPADRVRLDGLILSRPADKSHGVSRAN